MKAQKLFDRLAPDEIIEIAGSLDVAVTGFQIDSRKIKRGEVFVAMKGSNADGHNYIKKAIELGCALVICERPPEHEVAIPFVILKNVRRSIGYLVHY